MINDHSLNEYIKGMIDLDSFVEMPSDRSNRGSFILIDSENNSFEQPINFEVDAWTCKSCSLVNGEHQDECALCHEKRGWTCNQCTFFNIDKCDSENDKFDGRLTLRSTENDKTSDICEVCKAPKIDPIED